MSFRASHPLVRLIAFLAAGLFLACRLVAADPVRLVQANLAFEPPEAATWQEAPASARPADVLYGAQSADFSHTITIREMSLQGVAPGKFLGEFANRFKGERLRLKQAILEEGPVNLGRDKSIPMWRMRFQGLQGGLPVHEATYLLCFDGRLVVFTFQAAGSPEVLEDPAFMHPLATLQFLSAPGDGPTLEGLAAPSVNAWGLWLGVLCALGAVCAGYLRERSLFGGCSAALIIGVGVVFGFLAMLVPVALAIGLLWPRMGDRLQHRLHLPVIFVTGVTLVCCLVSFAS